MAALGGLSPKFPEGINNAPLECISKSAVPPYVSIAVPNLNLPLESNLATRLLLVYSFNVLSSSALMYVVSASLVNPINDCHTLLLYPSNVFLLELYLI